MDRVELLTIIDRFLIEGRGVVVCPDFPLADGWKNRADTVLVTKSDGQQFEALAQFSLSHYRTLNPDTLLGQGWRIILILPNLKKEDVPLGSKISVSPEIKDAIFPCSAA